ncbi:MAG TPA: hypothetical protein VME63_17415 [Dyella sp.]|uniref:hypothetical protein n=1 Tax=Dyella sp. TaxID=1869338 RepID=UPI002BE87C3E|nr:hypothetical protein [Dyella sp.]HTV87181.1 hypothetical protein [Dyella sp.]
MNEILSTLRQRFVKGLRQAPYEFFVPIVIAGRGIRFSLRFIAQQLDAAMAEARDKASRPRLRHK